MSGALYYLWVKGRTSNKAVPPCGHVAGIFARSDARVGVFKAPANEEVLGAVDLETEVTSAMQETLNPHGINCLRAFPGRGIRVWGARTLSEDPQWRYINVRRLFITVRRWIDVSMGWAVFEPNTPQLWTRIERELGGYLRGLWRLGALPGRTPEQAFYVKCDAETNPPDGSAEQVVTEIGLAPIAPAEFVVVRIVHRTPLTAGVGGE
jgi:phage tail sheath protein FI